MPPLLAEAHPLVCLVCLVYLVYFVGRGTDSEEVPDSDLTGAQPWRSCFKRLSSWSNRSC